MADFCRMVLREPAVWQIIGKSIGNVGRTVKTGAKLPFDYARFRTFQSRDRALATVRSANRSHELGRAAGPGRATATARDSTMRLNAIAEPLRALRSSHHATHARQQYPEHRRMRNSQ